MRRTVDAAQSAFAVPSRLSSPRFHRAITLGGLVGAAALMLACAASLRWTVIAAYGRWVLQLRSGALVWGTGGPIGEGRGVAIRRTPTAGLVVWWPAQSLDTVEGTLYYFPLWLPAAAALAPFAVAWPSEARAHRRIRAGRCPRCGYDRAGLALGATCPECGTVAAAAART